MNEIPWSIIVASMRLSKDVEALERLKASLEHIGYRVPLSERWHGATSMRPGDAQLLDERFSTIPAPEPFITVDEDEPTK